MLTWHAGSSAATEAAPVTDVSLCAVTVSGRVQEESRASTLIEFAVFRPEPTAVTRSLSDW
jgi:hypothetical protein